MRLEALVRRAALPLGAVAVALALAAPALAQAQAPSTRELQELRDQLRSLQQRIDQLEAADKQRQGVDARARAAAQQPAAPPRPTRVGAGGQPLRRLLPPGRHPPGRVLRQGRTTARSADRSRLRRQTSPTAVSCWAA